jgi:hypothetical protein
MLLLLLSGSAAPQQLLTTTNVPFEFTANGTVLPAGQYRITSTGRNTALMLQNVDFAQAVFVPFVAIMGN